MEMADGDRFTPEQAEALSALRDGRNVFLSGNAGTGKSYVLNAFISDLKARNVDFLALAPTGIAALNLTDGSTIHRTLKIAPGVCAPDGPKGSRKVLDAAKVMFVGHGDEFLQPHRVDGVGFALVEGVGVAQGEPRLDPDVFVPGEQRVADEHPASVRVLLLGAGSEEFIHPAFLMAAQEVVFRKAQHLVAFRRRGEVVAVY